jgi:hypothetical protein
MKKIILLLTIALMSVLQSHAQYSNYYKVDVNQNINAKIDVNQKISGEVTYKTIDYGALAKANALKEPNNVHYFNSSLK